MISDKVTYLVNALKMLFPNNPYFVGHTRGVQGCESRHVTLDAIVREQAKEHKRLNILEIGSWTGFSALTWSESLHRHCPEYGSITCVDPWRPYATMGDFQRADIYGAMNTMLLSGLAYALFLHNTQFVHHGIEFSHFVGTLEQAAPKLGRYDIIYIDGSHYYAEVLSDLRMADSMLVAGGILCGDDLELQFVECDEAHARANLHADFIVDPTAQRGFHPGVTLAVADHFKQPVWTQDSVWATRKTADGYVAPPAGWAKVD